MGTHSLRVLQREEMAMTSLPLFDALDACRHERTTTSRVHRPGTHGGSCQHDVTCDACGLLVGTESWNLALGAVQHAKAYPEAA